MDRRRGGLISNQFAELAVGHDHGSAVRRVIYATGHGGSSVAGDIVGAYEGGLIPSAIQAIIAA